MFDEEEVTMEEAVPEFYPTEPLPDSSVLSKVGEDVTRRVADENPGEAAGREPYLDQLMRILGRRTKANPVILGDAGVGKTFLVRLLARRIVEGRVPAWLEGRKVVRTSFYEIQATLPNVDWSWPQYMRILGELLEAAATLPVVLFFDEIHQIFVYPNSMNLVKPYLAGGRMRLIGASTTGEFHRFTAREEAIARRFQPIILPPPEGAVLTGIAEAECASLCRHHNINADARLVKETLRLADEYLPYRSQPDKTIDVLEQAFILAGWERSSAVLPEHARIAVSEMTGIPKVGPASGTDRSDGLEAELNRRVLGQTEAVHKVCRRLFVTRSRVQLYPERPLGVFMCAGPSGVGKTELAKALAQVYTGSEENLIRLDMSVYQSLASLLGRAGQPSPDNLDYLAPLTLALRRHPHGVLLLDEFEKADKEVWMAFLQAFDYGRMDDQQGNALHLGSHIVMMTCNTVDDNKPEQDRKLIGFVQTDAAYPPDKKAEDFREATGLKFPNEFLGRLDELLVFRPLTDSVMAGFIEQKLKRMERLSGKKLVVDEQVRELVRKRGFHEKYGARPLNLAIEDIIGTALARLKMTPDWEAADEVLVRLGNSNEPVAEAKV